MIRNLIWDMDGTLFDTYPAFTAGFAAVCAELDRSFPSDWITSLTRRELNHCANVLASELGISPEQVMERFGPHYAAILPEQQKPFPGVLEVCQYVQTMGGTNTVITHRRRESTLELLKVHGMSHLFTDLFTKDDDYPRKPDPTAFNVMIQKHGFAREETLGIGDRDIDILAAQGAGIYTCLFGTDTCDATPSLRITDYAALLESIKDSSRFPAVVNSVPGGYPI